MKQNKVFRVARRLFFRRKYKDILFRFVFREPEELLQLYNAMNQTDYTDPKDLIITTMEDVVYIGMKNDLSFLIANEMNLYEHQSTLNRNMPLRGLLYLARMYESYIETHKLNRYQKSLIPLPFPRFIVFYNGEEDVAEELYMRLSDAFEKKDEEPASGADISPELFAYITSMIEARREAKKNKNFAEADRIRDELLSRGITLLDTREGTKFTIN